jgi:dTDP-glucose pyrophosphorylase
MSVKKAVILARGLGTRMRLKSNKANLNSDQAKIAELGLKALIPISENRTFLDFILDNLKKANFLEICLVIGQEQEALKNFCQKNNLDFALQKEPLGTSDAVFSAKKFVANDNFLVVNSDNLYPISDLMKLQMLETAGLIAFERESLIKQSNISEDKINKFAEIKFDENNNLKQITEKPEVVSKNEVYISMNAWILSPKIFIACQNIKPSSRGEYELTSAVQFAIDELGETFKIIKSLSGVLDLSNREDIENVAKILENT